MTNIFVGNLSYQTTQEDLHAAFAQYGNVERVNIVTDRDTGQPRGLRSYDAECSAPPQSQHRAARAQAARSRSKTSNCSWNLASASTAWYTGSGPLE